MALPTSSSDDAAAAAAAAKPSSMDAACKQAPSWAHAGDVGHTQQQHHHHQQQQQQRVSGGGAAASGGCVDGHDDDDANIAHLFQTPADLQCPITHELLVDPVCNALGQVYERAALQRHLMQAALAGLPACDPVTNEPLPSLDLVPVFPMRSRAAEYRASTARACVAAAARPSCRDPVRLLRRAAELVLPGGGGAGGGGSPRAADATAAAAGAAAAAAGAPAGAAAAAAAATAPTPAAAAAAAAATAAARVPGMSPDFARFLLSSSHSQAAESATAAAAAAGAPPPPPPSEPQALKFFGGELLWAGEADAAAGVFYRLLLGAEDSREQQAEYLQLCLDAWASCDSGNNNADSNNKNGSAEAASGGVSAAVVDRLADLLQRQRRLGPAAILSMLAASPRPESRGAAMALARVLLARAAAGASAAHGPPSAAEAALGLRGGLGGALELVAAFADLQAGQLRERAALLETRVALLEAAAAAAAGDDADADGSEAGSLLDAIGGDDGDGDDARPLADVAGAAASGAAGAGAAAGAGGGAGGGGKLKPSPARAAGSRPPSRAAAAAAAAAAAGNNAGKAKRRARGPVWRGKGGGGELAARAGRLAAAGVLAVTTLVAGSHPLVRVSRAASLLCLLRTGL